jgi:cytochrome c-type biogenesis protein CcmH/NrfG
MEPETIEDMLALVKERPDDVDLYQRLGRLYFQQRDLQKAWEAYMQALKLEPDNPFTCLYFANLLTLWDDKKYAAELYERAVAVAPDLAVVHWCLAEFYRAQGQFDRAEQAYGQAVAVDPDDEVARKKLAEWRDFIANARNRRPDVK